jgi:hypothetical protein
MNIKKQKYILAVGIILVVGIALFKWHLTSSPAEEVLKKYLNATTWQEKLLYVNRVDLAQNLLQEHFKNVNLSTGERYFYLDTLEGSKAGPGHIAIKVVKNEIQSSSENRWYFLTKANNMYLIDYVATFGANQMTFKEILEKKPTESVFKTVTAVLGSNAENEIKNREHEYLSIKLTEPDTGDTLDVKVRKLDIQARDMFHYLKEGQQRPFLLQLYYSEFLKAFSVAKVIAPEAPNTLDVEIK